MDALVITLVLMLIINIVLYMQLKKVRATLAELQEGYEHEHTTIRRFNVTN